MKTQREIWIEAQRLEGLGQQFRDEQRSASTEQGFYRDAFSVIFTFPESRFSSRAVDGNGGIHVNRRLRRIEVGFVENALEYRLLQDEIETTHGGEVVRNEQLVLVATSASAADVLEEGYELADEERLGEALAPTFEKLAAGEFAHGIEPEALAEIEEIIEAGELLPAARLHSRADIARLLDGGVEPDEFIASAIQRHRQRETAAERIAQDVSERIAIGHP